ncbi:MAG: hypothetical protein WBO24_15685 [Nitrospirales bacterium]
MIFPSQGNVLSLPMPDGFGNGRYEKHRKPGTSDLPLPSLSPKARPTALIMGQTVYGSEFCDFSGFRGCEQHPGLSFEYGGSDVDQDFGR